MESVDLQRQAADCLAQDQYGEAISLYEQCIEAAPDVMSHYWKLGLALVLQGQEVEARTCWLSVIVEGDTAEIEERTSELIQVLETEGIKRLEANKYEQAEKIYLPIIELEPDNGRAYKNLGNATFSQGKLEEAIAYYQQGISLEPDAITYYNLGLVFHKQGKIEQAITCFE